jgi:Tfp pilus assembly protein PilO
MVSLLKEIESFANKSSVYLVDMKPAGLKPSDSSKKYLISLNCEAQMEQLSDFMYNIENSNKLLTIEKYQISPKSKESSVVRCSMSIAKIIMP